MNEKQIKDLIERMRELGYIYSYQGVKNIIREYEKLNKPEKVKVPPFVANFITEQKKLGYTLSYSIDASMSDRVAEWYWDNSELFALAWILGYEVEEEKRYRIRLKGLKKGCNCLNHDTKKDEWNFMSKYEIGDYYTKHTRKQLEDAGFGWVFDCPGIEIEDVIE